MGAGYEAGHQAAEHEQQAAAPWDHLVVTFHAQHDASEQEKINALLLETIHALASVLNDDHRTSTS